MFLVALVSEINFLPFPGLLPSYFKVGGDLYILSSYNSLWLTGLLATSNSPQGSTTLQGHLGLYADIVLVAKMTGSETNIRGQGPGTLNMLGAVP